jgi:hypothetical protein
MSTVLSLPPPVSIPFPDVYGGWFWNKNMLNPFIWFERAPAICSLLNVCRQKGSLLSFDYKFGWVAHRCYYLPPRDVILAQLAYPLSDIMFGLHSGRTNLSLYKHCESTYVLSLCHKRVTARMKGPKKAVRLFLTKAASI